jgi:hypothetical protein
MAVPNTKGIETAASYGISEALLAAYPELRTVYELFKQDNIGAAIEALFKTNYYKTTSSTVKAREKQKLEQPQVYADNVDKYKLAARKRLVNSGVRIDTATFDKLALDAYAGNLSDDQFDQAIVTSGKITGYGGEVLGDTNFLKSFAASMGVSSLYSDAYWTQKSKDLFSGTTTINDIEEEIKKLAASAYPAYADGIATGQSVETQASNVIQTIATFLEIDADRATKHPVFKQIMGYMDPETKKNAVMPQWLVERTVKGTKEWLKTKNALEAFDTVGMRPLEELGLV